MLNGTKGSHRQITRSTREINFQAVYAPTYNFSRFVIQVLSTFEFHTLNKIVGTCITNNRTKDIMGTAKRWLI